MSKKTTTFASNGRIARSGSLAAIVASLLAGSSTQSSITITKTDDESPSSLILQQLKNMTIIQNIYYVTGDIKISGDANISGIPFNDEDEA